MEMKTIKDTVQTSWSVEKSKFLGFLIPILSKEDVEEKLEQYKKEYFDATHVCYAYRLKEKGVDLFKCSDDGEPSSTAGLPILNVLNKSGIDNVLCIVVRYFGGIKLGAGGLVRAYSKTASSTLKEATIVRLRECMQYQLSFSYKEIALMDNYLNKLDAVIMKKQFEMQVLYDVILKNKKDLEILQDHFSQVMNYKEMGTQMIYVEETN